MAHQRKNDKYSGYLFAYIEGRSTAIGISVDGRTSIVSKNKSKEYSLGILKVF